MKALILAAGRGRKLHPFTATRPKPMISVSGSYILELIIQKLKEVGITDILLVVGHRKEVLMDYFKRGTEHDVNIRYLEQAARGDIGDAVLTAKDHMIPGEHFLLVYGDTVTSRNIFSQVLHTFGTFRSPMASVCLTPSTRMYGNIFMGRDMKITRIMEKPQRNNLGNYVLAGTFILPTRFFEMLEAAGGSMEKALDILIKENSLTASIWEDEWVDVAHPWDILSANKMIMDSWNSTFVSKTAQFKGDVKMDGPVHISDNVIIETGTVLKGPCYIGPRSFIGNNVLVREYTAVGADSVVGFGVELKNCVLFGRCKVGRLSFIGDSVVGENVYIGSGTMTITTSLAGETIKASVSGELLNTHLEKVGSFIGDESRIGSGHTLSAGLVIDPGTLIPHHFTYPTEGER